MIRYLLFFICLLRLVCGTALAQNAPTASSSAPRPTKIEVERITKHLSERKARENWRFQIDAIQFLEFNNAELTGAEREGLPSPELLAKRRQFALASLALYAKVKSKLGIRPPTLSGSACGVNATSFSWHNRGYVFPPENQNRSGAPCGSCWAFAAIAAYESSYLIENGFLADPDHSSISASEQRLLNCTPDSDCTLGYVYKALDTLVLKGTIHRKDRFGDYIGSKIPCLQANERYRAVAWGPITFNSTEIATPKRMKDVLCTFGPITSRIIITDSFKVFSGGDAFHQVDPVKITNDAHQVVIVGWDDSRGRNGAWLVKNSWGNDWGMKNEGMPGYAWVEYGANMIGHHANWVLAFHEKVSWSALEPEYSKLKAKYLPAP